VDPVRIRLKRGGRHGSELVSGRGAHHAFAFFRNLNLRGIRRGLSSKWSGCYSTPLGYSEKPLASSGPRSRVLRGKKGWSKASLRGDTEWAPGDRG